jgi:CheY-like chemotaxis protein
VRDTGIGITPEQQSRLFQPFAQADSATTRRFGGTGLGLVITKRLVEMMSGEIVLNSAAGQGTVVEMRIPLALCGEPATPPLTRRIRAMVVEGNPVARRAMLAALSEFALDGVDEAASEAEAKALFARNTYDLFLIDRDVYSPAFLESIRATAGRRKGASPTIIVAAPMTDYLRAPGEALEADFITAKPVRRSSLRTALAKLHIIENPTSSEPSRTNAATPVASRLHILLAEDNLINQRLVVFRLQRMGHTFRLAENGSKAIQAFREEWFDAVLMDCHMPEMDGCEATEELRAIEAANAGGPRAKIIAMTAAALESERKRGLDAGMDDYLTKPVNFERLQEALSGIRPIAKPGA